MLTRILRWLPLALILPALSPSNVWAGTYTHRVCSGGDATLSDRGLGWVPENPESLPGVMVVDGCRQGGFGLGINGAQGYAGAGLPAGVGLVIGAGPAWRYRPPDGAQVIAMAGDQLGWLRPSAGPAAVTAVVSGTGRVLRRLTDQDNPALTVRSRLTLSGLSESSLQIKLECTGSAGRCEGPDDWAWFDLRNVDVTIADDRAPTVTAAPTGALVSRPTLSGDADLAVSLEDAGGGVRQLQLLVDGDPLQTIAAAGGRCEPVSGQAGSWVFTAAQPCPAASRIVTTIDSRRIADGRHDLRLVAVDAAGNSTSLFHATRSVDNALPQPMRPPGFAADADLGRPRTGVAIDGDGGDWDRADTTVGYQWERCDATVTRCRPIDGATSIRYTPVAADIGSRLRLVVTATLPGGSRSEPTPPTGVVVAALAGAQSSCPGALRLVRSGSGSVRARYGVRAPVRITLTCGQDREPVAGARLLVRARPAGRVGPPTTTVLRTDRNGRAVLDAARGPSRSLTVSAAGGEAASLQISVVVRGRVTLAVRQAGSVARFSGRVAGGHIPGRGVTIELQWLDGSRWRPVASTVTDRRGRFAYNYRFSPRARGFRYSFRAVVTRGQIDYPFAPGRSGVRRAGL